MSERAYTPHVRSGGEKEQRNRRVREPDAG